jgi:tRNA threonylcarbamoyladenosine biosynthesis protein TsaE
VEYLVKSFSPEETFLLGQSLGKKLKGGEIICLQGELGAGKTVLAKGLGQGAGVIREITSPTFTLIQEYDTLSGTFSFVHMDLYRLKYSEEAEIIGVSEYFRDNCVCLIEWPEVIAVDLPEDRLDIRIEGSGDIPRSIYFNAPAEWENFLQFR